MIHSRESREYESELSYNERFVRTRNAYYFRPVDPTHKMKRTKLPIFYKGKRQRRNKHERNMKLYERYICINRLDVSESGEVNIP